MKVTRITLKDFHQFRDVDIDLTYPKGHAREGQPLDRVCIIGQSGTGKTTLLELIPKFLVNYDTIATDKIGEQRLVDKIIFSVCYGERNEYASKIKFRERNTKNLTWQWFENKLDGLQAKTNMFFDYLDNMWKSGASSKIIYYPYNLDYEEDLKEFNEVIGDDIIIDFSFDTVAAVWNPILEGIQEYQEYGLQIRQDIAKAAEYADDVKLDEAVQKLKAWKANGFNPFKDIADNCLDRLLQQFKLRVKTEFEIKRRGDIGFIKLEDINGNELSFSSWSTGTKQVVLSALPLYLTKPKNTVILFDEPERSLYPDLQRTIIDYYTSLTTNCQLFYATHSPIIASNFDPWEIVELKLDDDGKVYRELYFEGENHVNNYKYNPRYMRWDDILQRIFDLENDGSDDRKKMLDDLAEKNVKYRKLKQKGAEESDAGLKLLSEIQELSGKLSKWKD